MAITRLERKGRKNKHIAKNRVNAIKRLNTVPTIKKVDIETIREEFTKKGKKKPISKVEKAGTAPKEEKKMPAEKKTEEASAKGEKEVAPKKKTTPKAKTAPEK